MMRFVAFLMSIVGALNSKAELKTVDERVAEFGESVRARLTPRFGDASVEFPPKQIALLAFKEERVLEIYAAGADDNFRYVSSYPILAASGTLGPKLKEGDQQVPEGIYRVRELNPNSLFHLSLWLDYPNEFDQARAAEDGRTEPGSEIMIHGDNRSRGCLAMGDPAAEDLFVLAALTGIERVTVIIAPGDFRRRSITPPAGAPAWTTELYRIIAENLAAFPAP